MIDAIQMCLQAWVVNFLATELRQVAGVCLDRTVPEIVEAHVRIAIPPLLDESLPALIRRQVLAFLATVDEESPSGMALKGAIRSNVADRLDAIFPAVAGVDERA